MTRSTPPHRRSNICQQIPIPRYGPDWDAAFSRVLTNGISAPTGGTAPGLERRTNGGFHGFGEFFAEAFSLVKKIFGRYSLCDHRLLFWSCSMRACSTTLTGSSSQLRRRRKLGTRDRTNLLHGSSFNEQMAIWALRYCLNASRRN